MRLFTIVLILIVQFFAICCNKSQNTQNAIVKNQQEVKADLESTEEEIRDIIQAELDSSSDSYAYEILYLEKVDFGIPTGENWIVRYSSNGQGMFSKGISVFTIKNSKILKEYYNFDTEKDLGDADVEFYTQFDIMTGIPGKRFGNKAVSAFGDYNGDGVLDIFQYVFSGRGTFVSICGYDEEKDKFVNYCNTAIREIGFNIIDRQNGPAPVEFVTYKGRYGFKVYGPFYNDFPVEKLINNYYAWYFFSWDSDTHEFKNLGEYLVNQDDTEDKYTISDFSIQYFKIRLEAMFDNVMVLTDLAEIEPKISDGRSFKGIVTAASTMKTYGYVFNFNSEGLLVDWKQE